MNGLGNSVILSLTHDEAIFQFFQMAWADVREIGCAIVKCDDMINLVCRYYPAGIEFHQQVYDPREPCESCPWGTRCEVETGLCEQPEDSAKGLYIPSILLLILTLLL
ncbi:unnamed protein product [Cylicostephanus goldi]|uniref:SCP domain-containing protein n=1 Tax=Cylicostephanus goldi TaxID=71465 RepID=A0A3P6R7V5_CYLGO|nr:unnamed protein product [Cylicostephanus goldi]